MLITAAVVPGPPAFVAELMGSAAHELDDLRHAADSALSRTVSDLVAASSVSPYSDSGPAQVVVVAPGQRGEFKAAGPVSFAGFGRDVVVPGLVEDHSAGQPAARLGAGCRDLPTPLMVARYLVSRGVAAHPDHAELWASARWLTTSGADATVLGEQLRADAGLVALILVADGATCHGAKAPRAQDDRSQAYDDGVWAALASGRPGRLARADAALGVDLGATGPQVWPVLIAAAGGDGVGEVLWSGAPYGVGWAVATWRRSLGKRPLDRQEHRAAQSFRVGWALQTQEHGE